VQLIFGDENKIAEKFAKVDKNIRVRLFCDDLR